MTEIGYRTIESVVAYSELPQAYNPTAPMSFQTALKLMKEKSDEYVAKSLVSGNHWGISNDILRRTKPNTATFGFPDMFITIAEIEGTWEAI